MVWKTFDDYCEEFSDAVRRCEEEGREFEDENFTGDKCLGPEVADGSLEWQRAKDIFSGARVKLFDGVSPSDIQQGALGDCYLLSALSVLAEQPDRIRRLFVNGANGDGGAAPHGVYGVKMFTDGVPRVVVLDDRFPVFAGIQPPQPAFARNAGPELWAMLLEKAYAKCYGSYSAIAAGDPGDALTDLTGAPHRCFEVPPPKREDGQDVDDDGLYSRLLEFDQQGYAMCAAARSDPDVDLQADVGIVEEHAYGLIKVVRTRAGDRLLQLRNPWGQVEWKGDWSDRSDKWTPGTKRECGWSDADNGAFFMCWEDFRRVFGLVYVLFFHQGWQAKFESTTFDAGKACCMVDLAIFERMGMRLTLHQRRDPPPIGLRFSILDKTSRWPVGGSSQAFKAASTICSEEMMLSPGTYRVRVEVYPEHAARLPHELVLSAYCEKPGEAVLTDVEEDDAFPFCLPGFEDRYGTCGACAAPLAESHVSAFGKRFHGSCWACARCRRRFPLTNAQVFVTEDGMPQCAACMAAAAPRCCGCDKPILGRHVALLGKQWHAECLTCSRCGGRVGASFYTVDEAMLCSGCSKGATDNRPAQG